jgi:hypothetical protein
VNHMRLGSTITRFRQQLKTIRIGNEIRDTEL